MPIGRKWIDVRGCRTPCADSKEHSLASKPTPVVSCTAGPSTLRQMRAEFHLARNIGGRHRLGQVLPRFRSIDRQRLWRMSETRVPDLTGETGVRVLSHQRHQAMQPRSASGSQPVLGQWVIGSANNGRELGATETIRCPHSFPTF